MSAPSLPPPRHLIVRLPNPLGDAVMATPALRALRTALPNTRLTWAGGGVPQQALEGLPWRDDVLSLAGELVKGARAPVRAARQLRRLGADAILLLPNSFSSALAARLAGIPTRVGTPLQRRGLLLTHKVALPLGPDRRLAPRSMRAHYLDLVAPFGAHDDGQGTAAAVTPFDAERAALRLRDLPEGALLVGVNPGAAFGPSKVYPPALLGQALQLLRARTGALPLVLCGPGEAALAREVAAAAGEPCLVTADDPPDVGTLKGLLARCRVLLTTDAGPRHLAEALGVPTVVWVGPTDPRWGEGGRSTVLRVEGLTCLACHEPICPIDHPCMLKLLPERIAEAAQGALGAARSAQGG
jgi:heptosyltransferase-2